MIDNEKSGSGVGKMEEKRSEGEASAWRSERGILEVTLSQSLARESKIRFTRVVMYDNLFTIV